MSIYIFFSDEIEEFKVCVCTAKIPDLLTVAQKCKRKYLKIPQSIGCSYAYNIFFFQGNSQNNNFKP